MDFKTISNQELILRLGKLARTERKITHHILWHLVEVESRKLYFKLGFESLYAYLIKELKYSESAAYRRIHAARLLTAAPVEVTEKLESGVLNLSQLAQVQKCLSYKKKGGHAVGSNKVSAVLRALENKNTFDSESILAKEFDLPMKMVDQAKPQKDDSVRVEVTLNKEQFAALKLAKSLLSHQCPEGQWSEVITLLAEKFCQSRLGKFEPKVEAKIKDNFKFSKVDSAGAMTSRSVTIEASPIAPASTQLVNDSLLAQSDTATEAGRDLHPAPSANSDSASGSASGSTSNSDPKNIQNKRHPYRPALSVKVKRAVFAHAQHQCEFRDSTNKQRCTSKFQLEIDHRKPLALGGDDELKNLRILCRRHNQHAWQQSLGAS